jgi:hypothetical protein
MKLTTAIAAAGCIIALAGCSAAANQAASTGTPTASAAPTVPTDLPTLPPTDTPTPGPTGVAIGTPVITTAGDTYLVIAYKARVTSNNEFNTPPPGGWFAAADVKICAGSTQVLADAANWSLGLADDSQIQGESSGLVNVPGADFPFENLNPGSCISGWVAFSVPGGTVVKIVPQNSDFYWTV